MQFGQLPAQTQGTVGTEIRDHILQRCQQLVRGLVENHGPLLFPQSFQMSKPAFFRSGQEALKAEAPRQLPGNAQGGNGGAGAWNGGDGNPGFGTLPDQFLAGVGNGRASRVGNQCTVFSRQNPGNDPVPPESLVVFIVADQGLMQLQMVQKLQGHPGILRGDEIRLRKGTGGSG